MKYLLQKPLPDELLGSVWLRSARTAGVPLKTAARWLTGNRGWSPVLLGCGNIGHIADALGTSSDELLWSHTVFPYASALFSEPTFLQTLRIALGKGERGAGFSSVVQGVSSYVPLRRFCQSCVKEDRRCWGESYWRRMHHLPGVLFCPVHLEPLQQTRLPTAKHCCVLDGPQDCHGHAVVRGRPTRSESLLAEFSLTALTRHPDPLHLSLPLPKPDHYRSALQAANYLDARGYASREHLAAWGRNALPRRPEVLGLRGADAQMTWMSRMLTLKPSHPAGTFKHLLFSSLLEAARQDGKDADLNHVNYLPVAKPKAAADARYAALLRSVVRQYEAVGERVRVCDALALVGCWSTFRHQRNAFPRLAAAVAELKTSNAAARPNWGKRHRPAAPE